MSILQWFEHYAVVIMFVVVVGIIAATYWPGRKAKIEQLGNIPLEDDV
ncbi:MAG: CcoQ/FixQ family Cbb3-type cytochrome c oxidase assembly chaperone [Rhodopila sp.]|jgi:cbb3-type cytochrome oxidase subunit 3